MNKYSPLLLCAVLASLATDCQVQAIKRYKFIGTVESDKLEEGIIDRYTVTFSDGPDRFIGQYYTTIMDREKSELLNLTLNRGDIVTLSLSQDPYRHHSFSFRPEDIIKFEPLSYKLR